MSVNATFRVEGIDVNIAALNAMDHDIEAAKYEILNKASTTHQANLRQLVHVWQPGKPRRKPHMRDTIREERRGPNYVIVTVPTTYANIENRRGGSKSGFGPHNFLDQAERKTNPIVTQFFYQKMREVVNSHKVR